MHPIPPPHVQIQRGFDIPHIPHDLTGGYLLEQDMEGRYCLEPSGFITRSNQAVTIKSPKFSSKEQVNYIANYFQEMEDAIMENNGINPTTGKHYFEYIDIESWAKKYIIEELTKNFDMGISSSYFYKPSGENSKIYAGPLWDYDGGFAYWEGEHFGTIVDSPEDLISIKYHESGEGTQYFYYAYIQPEFRNEVISIFQETVLPVLNTYITSSIDDYQLYIKDSAHMDYLRWNKATKWRSLSTVDEETLKVKNFLKERTAYLKTVWKY